MKTKTEINQEDFDSLLSWLSLSRDEAGEQYEHIRNGLVRFFRFRGSQDPAVMADETINRVALKIHKLDVGPKVKKINVFYGFATKIHLESLSAAEKKEVQFEPDVHDRDVKVEESRDSEERMHLCLEGCLLKLAPAESALILRYYSGSEVARLGLRKSLAKDMGLSTGALHTKVCRIRNALRACMDECVEQDNV